MTTKKPIKAPKAKLAAETPPASSTGLVGALDALCADLEAVTTVGMDPEGAGALLVALERAANAIGKAHGLVKGHVQG